MSMSRLIEVLKSCPQPYHTWLKIEKDLLDYELIKRLDAETIIAGSVISLIPENQRDDYLKQAQEVAEQSIAFYSHYGNSDVFNNNRIRIREAMRGHLGA